jgi:hypothetical protein
MREKAAKLAKWCLLVKWDYWDKKKIAGLCNFVWSKQNGNARFPSAFTIPIRYRQDAAGFNIHVGRKRIETRKARRCVREGFGGLVFCSIGCVMFLIPNRDTLPRAAGTCLEAGVDQAGRTMPAKKAWRAGLGSVMGIPWKELRRIRKESGRWLS